MIVLKYACIVLATSSSLALLYIVLLKKKLSKERRKVSSMKAHSKIITNTIVKFLSDHEDLRDNFDQYYAKEIDDYENCKSNRASN